MPRFQVLTFTLLCCVIGNQCLADDPQPVSFGEDIRPILAAHCFGCHQPARGQGDYFMTEFAQLLAGGESGDPAIVPGKPDESYLVELITPEDGVAEMPPEGTPLSSTQVDLIRRWIAEGAKNDYTKKTSRFDAEHPPTYSRLPNITTLDFSPDGNYLAINGFHEILLLATGEAAQTTENNPVTATISRRLVGMSPRIESLQFSPDGKRIAASGGSPGEIGEIQIWNVETGALELSKVVSFDTAYGVNWSPDGKLVAFGLTDTTLRAIDARTGEQVLFQGAHEDWIRDTVFSPDGKQLVSVGRDMTCKLVDVGTQRFIDNITSITPGVLKGGIASVARHPSRDEIVIGGADGIPKVYRMNRITKRVIGDDANLVRLLPKLEGRIQSVSVSGDGKRIAAGGSLDGSGSVQVYSYEFDPAVSAELKKILEKQPGQWSTAEQQVVNAYNTADVKLVASTEIADSGVYAVAFHPSGKWVVAAGTDGLIRFLDTESGKLLFQLQPVSTSKAASQATDIAKWQFDAQELGAPPTPLFSTSGEDISALQVSPEQIHFDSPTDYAQLVVMALLTDGTSIDVTHQVEAVFDSSVIQVNNSLVQVSGNGTTELAISLGAANYRIPVTVSIADSGHVPDFRRDVNPILTKLGCNAGTCHGSATGKMGFKLSLRGYDPIFDIRALTDDMGSRRTNLASPQDSLMLLKPTATVPHKGGQVLQPDSKYYQVVHDWIQGGAELNLNSPRVQSVHVYPQNPILADADWRQQMRVVATYDNGDQKDVTRESFIEIGDLEIAAVEGSTVTALRRGETPVLARFEGAYTATTLTVMGDRSGFAWEEPESWSEIDRLVADKWQVMKIKPSGLCTDSEFIRRVHLDLTGLPPTAESVTAFLADNRPTRKKRDELVDQLIGNEDFVEHWSNKWADLLQVNRKYLGAEGAQSFRDWIREQVRTNRPYDEFAHEVLTSTGSNKDHPAASYYKIHRTPEDAMENTTHLFLATRFNCNKCHDHPFERWTQDQYYETAAFFAQVSLTRDPQSGDRNIAGSAVEKPTPLYEIIADAENGDVIHVRTAEIAPPKFPFDCDFAAPENETRRARLAAWITSPDNPYFATSYVNRLWGYLMGTGLIEPLDDIRAGNPATNPELLELLRRSFVDGGFNAPEMMRMICKSRTYQLSIKTNPFNQDDNLNYSHALARRLPAEVIFDAIHRVTGSQPKIPGVAPGTRAAALPDGGAKLTSGFLATLGRPARESVCECERSSELQLGSVLALVSGPDVSAAINDPNNSIQELVQAELDDATVINQMYLRILNRPATTQEIALAEESVANIRNDHKALIEALEEQRGVAESKRPELEKQRLEAIANTEQALADKIAELDPTLLEKESSRLAAISAAEVALAEYANGEAAFENWKKLQLEEANWHLLLPAGVETKLKRPFTILEDRSILMKPLEGKDVYSVTGRTDLSGIANVRLEMLTHESLPAKGPGLAPNGNLVLTEFTMEIAHPDDPKKWQPIAFESAVANFEQPNFPITNTFDTKSDDNLGWALGDSVGQTNWASFRLKVPVGYSGGTLVRFRMHQSFDDKHQIGRFRISLSQHHQPIGLGLPESLTAQLATGNIQDNEPLKNTLMAAFKKGDLEFGRLDQAVMEAKKPLTIDPKIIALREKLARVTKPVPPDAKLVQLENDVKTSASQLENTRLTAAQDLAWALINSSSFLFNH